MRAIANGHDFARPLKLEIHAVLCKRQHGSVIILYLDLDETELAEVISGEDEGEAEASDISSIGEINSVSEEALNDLAEAQEEE